MILLILIDHNDLAQVPFTRVDPLPISEHFVESSNSAGNILKWVMLCRAISGLCYKLSKPYPRGIFGSLHRACLLYNAIICFMIYVLFLFKMDLI